MITERRTEFEHRTGTTTARAVLFDEVGGPEVLRFEEVELRAPGPGEVRVCVDAIGLNRAEVLLRSGGYWYDATLPGSRLGQEAAGVVEAVGPGVEGFSPGDAVSTMPKPQDPGQSRYGVYGDRVVVGARQLLHRPDDMDAVTGAAIWIPALTAYGALIDVGGMQAGDTVVVTAASSTTGVAAIQVANRVGAVPIAVTRTGAKADRLRDVGAAHVIASEDGDVVAQVHALTGDRGADIVFDAVGGPGLPELSLAVAEGGTLVVYGVLDTRPTLFPTVWPLKMFGYYTVHLFGDPKQMRRAEAFVHHGLRAGTLAPVIARTFDLSEIVDAHRAMESNDQVGKIVVTVEH